jgi:transposase-like protein
MERRKFTREFKLEAVKLIAKRDRCANLHEVSPLPQVSTPIVSSESQACSAARTSSKRHDHADAPFYG